MLFLVCEYIVSALYTPRKYFFVLQFLACFSHSCNRFWFYFHRRNVTETPTKQRVPDLILTIDAYIGMWAATRVNQFKSIMTCSTEQADNFPEFHSKIDDETFLLTLFMHAKCFFLSLFLLDSRLNPSRLSWIKFEKNIFISLLRGICNDFAHNKKCDPKSFFAW